jgi:hypothetical protein
MSAGSNYIQWQKMLPIFCNCSGQEMICCTAKQGDGSIAFPSVLRFSTETLEPSHSFANAILPE